MFKLHTIFPFLKFMFAFLALNFAAGADVLGAIDGAETIVVNSDEGEDTGAEGAGEGEGSGEGEGEGEGQGEGAGKPQGGTAAAGPQLAKPLSQAASTALKGLKESDPKAWKELNSRIWALNGIDQKIAEHFPEGGIESAIQLKGNVDSFLEAGKWRDLNDAQSEINDFRNTDAKIIKGDPTFLNDLPENVRAGIDKMMPDFVGQWADRDKEGHDRYFAGLVVSTLRDTDFTMNMRTAIRELERMGLEDSDVKTVHDLLKANFDWIEKLKEKASAAPAKKPNAAEGDDEVKRERQTIQQEKIKLARQRIGGEFRRYADAKMLNALKSIHGGKIPANVNKGEVLLRALRGLGETLGQSFEEKITQYLQAGDEAGALKYTTSQATEARLVEAVKKANAYLYGNPTLGARRTTNNGTNNGARNGAGAGAGGNKPDAGFVKVNFNPKPSSIDYAASDKLAKELGLPSRNRLFAQNKAVLKNGKKVTWDREAADEQ